MLRGAGSYNAVNGVPACLSSEMINGVMRDGWGFDGFVVSDCKTHTANSCPQQRLV